VLTVENLWSGAGSPIASCFQWASALATAGFSTAAIETWSPSSKLLLCLAMSCGGAAGATTGGLRMSRVILLTQAAADRIGGVAMHPWRLMTGKPIASEKAEQRFRRRLEAATTMVVLWVGIVFMGTLLLLHAVGPTVGLDDVLFEVSSALNNVGLTTGITSPDLTSSGKAALILLMWLGRLEIVPVLVLVAVVVAHPIHRLQGMMEERHSRR